MGDNRTGNKELLGENVIDAMAIEWVAQLDRADPDPRHADELEKWLAQDVRHRGAFLRAQAAWKSFDKLQILRHQADDARPVQDRALSRRAILQSGAAASGAGLLAAAAAAVGFFRISRHQILTPVGEIRRVPLVDGSIMAVNTDSKVNVDIKSDAREITLERGEVWFDVAKDNKRPFVVTSGDVRVQAVGTAFSVRRRDDGTDVLVTEGVVETWRAGDAEQRRQVTVGSKVFVSDIAGPSEVVAAPSQIDRALAWREGEIALDGETLAEAAVEFNRYNERRLTIDPALTDKRLVGWFHTNEPETFARAAAAVLKLKVTATAEQIHLSPISEDAGATSGTGAQSQ